MSLAGTSRKMRRSYMLSAPELTTVILDLDGPVLDGMNRHYQCYRDILDDHGVTPIPLDLYWEMKRSRVDRKQLLYLSNAVELYDLFLASWIDRIETKQLLELDRLQYNVAAILTHWKQSNMRLLLATLRRNHANLHWQLETLGIKNLFDEIIAIGNVGQQQSKADAVKAYIRDTPLCEIIWIGDTEVDIHAAQELGIAVCGLACGLRTDEYLDSLQPDCLEPDLNSFYEWWLRHDRTMSNN